MTVQAFLIFCAFGNPQVILSCNWGCALFRKSLIGFKLCQTGDVAFCKIFRLLGR